MIQVIVADETLIERKYLRGILERFGLDVVSESGNGIHAFNEYRIFKPSLIFLSLSLPMMDGLTCMRRIKDLYPDAKVILLGAEGDSRIIFEGLESGAEEYLMKPFNMTQVEKVVFKALKSSGIELRK